MRDPQYEARYIDYLFHYCFSIAEEAMIQSFREYPGVNSDVQAVIRYARFANAWRLPR